MLGDRFFVRDFQPQFSAFDFFVHVTISTFIIWIYFFMSEVSFQWLFTFVMRVGRSLNSII